MKTLLISFIALITSLSASLAFAGSANMTNINIRGHSYSTTYASGYSGVDEYAYGYRHLDASVSPKISVRDEYYSRDSHKNSQYHETTNSHSYTVGSIMDATRVGESMFYTNSYSQTNGVSYDNSGYTELGYFTAYDQVNDSYSAEAGNYLAYGADYATTYYSAYNNADIYSESAYGLYGSN